MRNVAIGLATALVLAILIVVRHGGGLAALAGSGESSYTFIATQPGHPTVPVTYSSCKPIRVELNLDGVRQQDCAKTLLLEAMGEVSAATKLSLVYAGPTHRRPRWPDSTLTVEGGAWPVLISFADGDEIPDLEGNAGIGGSSGIVRNGSETYVTGQVTLARDYLNKLLARPGGRKEAKAIAMHELGHVVGLGHVQDDRQLMSEHGHGGYAFAAGDRHGLSRLGQGPCT